MNYLLLFSSLFITYVSCAPGYDFHGLDLYSPTIIKSAPLISAPLISHAPILDHAPIIKAPIYAPAPIIKTIVPATSYASVTQYQIAHPIKTIVAAPPILKVATPLTLAHGYDYGHGYGYH